MKNKKVLFGIILVFVFFLSMSLTYAFFEVVMNPNSNPEEILTSTGTLELSYDAGSAILAEDIFPGWTTTKTLTVTNTGSLNIYYSINWESITNTFIRNELVMSMTCTGEGCATINEEPVGKTDGPFIDTIKIVPGVTHTYELTITFIDTGSVQNYNQGKTFNGVLTVAESDGYFDMYGTLVNASNETIAGATVTLMSEPRTTITDENGNFMFVNVEADNHTLSAAVNDEEILEGALTIINGEKTEITDTTVTRRTKTKQINVKVKAGSDKSITSIEEVHNILSPSWATKLSISKRDIIAIAVETTIESPPTYTFNGTTYNRSKNGIDVSESTNGSVLASTYTDGTKEVIVMINSRGMTSLPSNSKYLFSGKSLSPYFDNLKYLQAENLDTSQVTNMSWMIYSAGRYSNVLNMDLSNWDTSQVTDMSYMFNYVGESSTTWNIGDLSNWDTSKVQNMSTMFSQSANNVTTLNIGDLGNWDTSQVINMEQMFSSFGQKATSWSIGDLSNWDTSKVTTMSYLFSNAGKKSTTWDIGDLSNWDTSSVIIMSNLFYSAGYSATTWNIGDLSNWDTSNVTSMWSMFYESGYSADTFNLDLSSWDTSKVVYMNHLFFSAGYNATTWNIGDINEWNTSNVTSMASMFNRAGYNAESFSLNLSSWNTSKVDDMIYMFQKVGYNATNIDIDLSSWDTSKVTDIYMLFYQAGYNATNIDIDLSSWNMPLLTSAGQIFFQTGVDSTSFNVDLSSWNMPLITNMSSFFNGAGGRATTFNLNLSDWNTSQVISMESMFTMVGYNSETFNLNLSNWDTSKVTNMHDMFDGAGRSATTSTLNIKGFYLSSNNTVLTNYSYLFAGMNPNAQIIVGSQDSKDWILGLNSTDRPSVWTGSNILIN